MNITSTNTKKKNTLKINTYGVNKNKNSTPIYLKNENIKNLIKLLQKGEKK